MKQLVLFLFLVSAIHCSTFTKKNKENDYFSIIISGRKIEGRFIKEMETISRIDNCSLEVSIAPDQKHLIQQWKELSTALKKKITIPHVIAISTYAKKETETFYTSIKPLQMVTLHQKKSTCDPAMVTYEGTIDTLPSHSPIVKRYLKIFALYSTSRMIFTEFYITIRGELLE